MSRLLICFIALNFFHCSTILADESSGAVALPKPPYCGGQSTDAKNIPWLVYVLARPLYSTDDTRCAGTLINSRWVLTAAHCVTGFEKFIELGDRSTARVDKKILHPDFNENDKVWNGDIALLRLTKPLNYSQEVQPICLPLQTIEGENFNVDTKVEVVSWSHPIDSRLKSDFKNSTSIYILNKQFCEDSFESYGLPFKATHQFCLSSHLCLENTGEFLQFKKNDVYYQVGLMTSASKQCTAMDEVSDVYNRIDAYVDWIAETVSANEN